MVERLLDEAVDGHALLGRTILDVVSRYLEGLIREEAKLQAERLQAQELQEMEHKGHKGPPEHDVEPGERDVTVIECETVIDFEGVSQEAELLEGGASFTQTLDFAGRLHQVLTHVQVVEA